jgi:hypothetical protein
MSPFDPKRLLKDSEYVYEDLTFQPVQYWKIEEYVQNIVRYQKSNYDFFFSKHSNYELQSSDLLELYKAGCPIR